MVKLLKKSAPIPLALFANASNVGFAAANNQAMLHAKGKYLLLLNSDTIIQSGCFEQLLKTMSSDKSSTIGILAASLVNEDGSVQPQGGDLPSLASLFVFAFMLDDIPLLGKLLPSHQHTGRRYLQSKKHRPQLKGWVGGTAMIVRSALVPQIGVLDDQIFMYAEDLEYCWRAHKAGWHAAIHPTATVMHLGSRSSSAESAITGELLSLRYVLNKHMPTWQTGIGVWLLKTAVRTRIFVFTLANNPTKVEIYRSLLQRL
jgi:hypothetical protein